VVFEGNKHLLRRGATANKSAAATTVIYALRNAIGRKAMLTEKQLVQTAARQQRFRKRQQEARQCEQRKKGLPPMPAISTIPGTARWGATLRSAEALLSQAVEEMAAYYDERSECWQEGDAGVEHAERQEALESVLSELQQVPI